MHKASFERCEREVWSTGLDSIAKRRKRLKIVVPFPVHLSVSSSDLRANLMKSKNMAGRIWESPVAHLLAAAFASFVAGGMLAGFVRVRLALAAVVLLGIVAIVGSRFAATAPETATTRRRLPAPGLLAVGFLIIVALHWRTTGLDTFEITRWATLWLMGWSLYLIAMAGGLHPEDGISRARAGSLRLSTRSSALLIGVVSSVVLAAASWLVAGGGTVVIDETLYALQARLFGQPNFSLQFDSSVQQHFMLRQSLYADGGMFTQYPPGWPALLAIFDSVGLLRWAGMLLGAASVVLTYLLGLRLHSRGAGAIAAALLCLHPLFLMFANSLWSHSASTFFLLLVAHLMIGDHSSHKAQWWRWMAIGLCLGAAFTIRPLTAVGVGGSIAFWYVIRYRPPRARVALAAAFLLAGVLPMLAATGLYNEATTGSAFEFGYTAALKPLGPGAAGQVAYHEGGVAKAMVQDKSAVDSVQQQGLVIWTLIVTMLPVALLVPFTVLASRFGLPFRRLSAAAFLLLPVAYTLWFYAAPRFYVELLPFAFIGIGAMYEQIRRREPALARRAAIYALLLVPSVAIAETFANRAIFKPCRNSRAEVQRLSAGTPLVAFVKDSPSAVGSEMLLECLYLYNTEGLDGPVVVARDLGDANSTLLLRYPEHDAIRLRWDSNRNVAVTERLIQ